jgi:predicted DsbA family dithiol-disulfide isomerase
MNRSVSPTVPTQSTAEERQRSGADSHPSGATSLRVDIWSDIACPWCYVGKRRLESALADFEHREQVAVVWHAFELKPEAPPVESSDLSYAERLASKYHTTPAEAQGMMDQMTGVAAADGLAFRFDRIQPGNTFNAHRLLHLAADHGRQDALKERFLRAYLTEGEPIGDREALLRLAVEVELPEDEVAALLGSDRFAEAVRADEAQAQRLGISGVPFFVFGNHYALSGAQPPAVLLGALDQAWTERLESPHGEGR